MDHQRKTYLRITLLLLTAVLLSSCGNGSTPMPTPDINELVTRAIIQTREAAEAEVSATAEEPTAAPLSGTAETAQTEAVVILPTSGQNSLLPQVLPEMAILQQSSPTAEEVSVRIPIPEPTATATIPPGKNIGEWAGQSLDDNVTVEANSEFDIIWYFRNLGTTTWTTDYTCRYFTGTDFTKPGKIYYPLRETVPPNGIGRCIVDAVAPSEPGYYKMSVVLGDENEDNFVIVDLELWVK